MRTLLLAAGAALALSGPALAHDFAGDLVCSITDRNGNALSYSFANNTNEDPVETETFVVVLAGTYVETAFSRNGKLTASPQGARPVWRYTTMPDRDTENIVSQQDPEWSLALENLRTSRQGMTHASARLVHNGATFGSGDCNRDGFKAMHQPAAPSPRVPDQAN